MKAIFIPTGEEIELQTVIDVPTQTATFIELGDKDKVPIPADLIAFPPNRQERRYELAKMFMRDRLSHESDTSYIIRHRDEFVRLSVQCADALLSALHPSDSDNEQDNGDE